MTKEEVLKVLKARTPRTKAGRLTKEFSIKTAENDFPIFLILVDGDKMSTTRTMDEESFAANFAKYLLECEEDGDLSPEDFLAEVYTNLDLLRKGEG